MASQDHFWSKAAGSYETDFIDPYRPDVRSPLLRVLRRLADPDRGVVADLGCGIGPLLPLLSEQFRTVYAVDFAEGMLERARQRCVGLKNVTFLQRGLTDLAPLAGKLDVAVAINSLVLPDVTDLEEALSQYEKGVGLLKLCVSQLRLAEQRIQTLTGETPEGQAVTTRFDHAATKSR